jgi:uncharacterized protein YkwD
MKKLLLTTIVTILAACSFPFTSQAAEVKLLKKGNGYVLFGGQGIDCLQEMLKKIYTDLGSGSFLCPDLSDTPTQPDNSVKPDNQKPDNQKPDNQKPDNQQPDNQTKPDNQQPNGQKPDNSTQPDNSQPDAETPEEELHSYAVQILNLVNAERTKAGLTELKLDLNITAAANVRAKEIKQSFSHTRPNGKNFSSALTEQGVSFRRSGENIAWGQKSPEQVMNGWMNSSGHRANILNSSFENIGIGYYQDTNGVNYWVQLFTA